MLGKNDVSYSISNVHPSYLVGVRPTKEAIVHMKARETFILKRPNHSLLNLDVTKLSTVPHLRPKVNDVYLISNEGDRTRTNDWPCDWYSWKNRSGHSKTIECKTVWCQNRFIQCFDRATESDFQCRTTPVQISSIVCGFFCIFSTRPQKEDKTRGNVTIEEPWLCIITTWNNYYIPQMKNTRWENVHQLLGSMEFAKVWLYFWHKNWKPEHVD